ncbi:2-hydroxymuconate tautomerase [Azospirillum sp. RWY-5-1]|uniref:2-hydroxymuconate tautomerase n=1 Tax=Azospirillum oleiclasticum TaxID=2735135 RepID=A0ABX2TE48_9PROT|nr:tautomerase family protein [Azospirillum oleiclasticum]NYZ15582.1 2-hydroxymuconate tautomerase [Azospirillum oleiclasticum]NYZ22605.1 2-hydroxymuconate tautomerase [Azospirillum oleiclasticum]
MPIIDITLVQGRPDDRIERLIAEVTDAAVRSLDAPRETVRVVVREVPPSRFGVAGRSKAAGGAA